MAEMTLNYIKEIMDAYIQSLRSFDSDDDVSYNDHKAQDDKLFMECFDMLRDSHPELMQINMPTFLDNEDSEALKAKFRENASRRYSLDILPIGNCFCDRINSEDYYTPSFVAWQSENNSFQNFVINYNNNQKREAKEALNGLLMNMVLGLPVKKVLLNVFDFSMTGLADTFTVNLEPQLYHDEIVVDQQTAHARLKELLEHMATVMKKYGNLVAYNNHHQDIVMPYEVVVLNNYPDKYDAYIDELIPLFENGARCGIYFIVMNNTDCHLRDKEAKTILDTQNYQVLKLPNLDEKHEGKVSFTPLHRNSLLSRVCFDYFHEGANYVAKRAVLKQDFDILQKQAYEPVMSEISVTVGLDIEKKQPVTFRFNSGDYIHAFILGQSGSGKSVLLNNIITTAINKYSPEDLMLYLMDFKGVEFNRYRGVKHTKAVLVDNSDPQLTLEVLRELKEENKKRVKLWQQEGVNNIDGYNKKHPDNRLPQVLFIADECQVMFSRVDAGVNSHVIQREIAEIINIIATQGRSQGIHMLLATQQLDETDISGQVLKNLTECFLLMSAPSDSDRLVPDSSDFTAKQPTGQCCYYHKKELQAQVQTYYATDEELEQAISASQQKASENKSNGEAYFKGSSMFWLDDKEKTALLNNNGIVASVGRTIGMKGNQTIIPLKKDFSENILFFGANKEEQTIGTTINAMMSLMLTYHKEDQYCEFIVIDCTNNSQGKYHKILDSLQENCYCRVVDRSNSASVLKRLADDIFNQMASNTILIIIGNERFAEIKRNAELTITAPVDFDPMGDINFDMSCMTDLNGNSYESAGGANIKTFPQALRYILDEGPTQGVHTLLQVDKPANILFEGEYGNNALDKFRHKVMLRSENKYLTVMRFSIDIDVEILSDEEEHLRAYYYPEDGEPQLFTPYLMPDGIDILK